MRRFLNTEDAYEKLLRRQRERKERSVDHLTDQQLEGTEEFQHLKKLISGAILSIVILVMIFIFVIISKGISKMEQGDYSEGLKVIESVNESMKLESNNILIEDQAHQNIIKIDELSINPENDKIRSICLDGYRYDIISSHIAIVLDSEGREIPCFN